jgi:hypothetical protein
MSHSLCVMGVYDEVKMTVPMVVRYVHSDKTKKNVTRPLGQSCGKILLHEDVLDYFIFFSLVHVSDQIH